MSNMSYCRFQNTLTDLRDCYNHMDEDDDELNSDYERKARKQLIQLCVEIADEYYQQKEEI